MIHLQDSLCAVCVVSLSAMPQIAAAQGSGQSSSTENIVVTAQKREQRLLDVPLSIQAFSGEELQEQGIDSVEDLGFSVPGLTTRQDGPGSYQIFMRGVANQYGPGALVGGYLDEAPITLSGYDQLAVPPIDIERVEVLKGPQGTLYGQGSVAGTVRYISKDPVLDAVEGSIKGSVATIDEGGITHGYTGVINAPIVEDTAALRIAAKVEDGGGWIDQPEAGIEDGNGTEVHHIRVKGLWDVNELLTAETMIISHRADTQLGTGFEQPDRTNFVAIDPSTELIPKEYDYNLYNVDLTFDLGFADLLSASTYIDHDHQYPFAYQQGGPEFRGARLEGNDERDVTLEQFTQELRLTSTGFGPLDWTVGAFYRDVEKDLKASSDTLVQASGNVFRNAPYREVTTNESYSLFANASYDFTDRLELGAGLRYFKDDATANYLTTDLKSDSFDSVDPRVYASYAVTDTANIFGSVSRGFRSGGFNTADLPSFDSESLINYEIGTKARFMDGLVKTNLTAYYSEYDDMLRRGLLFVNNGLRSLVSNIGKAEIMGVEGGLTVQPVRDLTLNATFAAIDSEIVEVNSESGSGGQATNVEGDPVDYVPDVSFTLGVHYAFNWAENMPGYVRLDYSYRDKLPYTDRTSFVDSAVPQYSDIVRLLDARAGLTYGPVSYELFATNLTNENVYIDPYSAWNNANRTQPRTVGVSATYKFD